VELVAKERELLGFAPECKPQPVET